jgi:hypothetical protein
MNESTGDGVALLQTHRRVNRLAVLLSPDTGPWRGRIGQDQAGEAPMAAARSSPFASGMPRNGQKHPSRFFDFARNERRLCRYASTTALP